MEAQSNTRDSIPSENQNVNQAAFTNSLQNSRWVAENQGRYVAFTGGQQCGWAWNQEHLERRTKKLHPDADVFIGKVE